MGCVPARARVCVRVRGACVCLSALVHMFVYECVFVFVCAHVFVCASARVAGRANTMYIRLPSPVLMLTTLHQVHILG